MVKADTQGSVEAIVDALKKNRVRQGSLGDHTQRRGTITNRNVGPRVGLGMRSSWVFHTRVDSVGSGQGPSTRGYRSSSTPYLRVDRPVKEAMAGLLEPS